MLLHIIQRPTSFNQLKTVNGVVCETYQIACLRLGLLEDDEHWEHTLNEAAACETPYRLRYLFALMLVVCQVADPRALWDKHKEHFAEDILYQFQTRSNNSQLGYNDSIFNKTLLLLQETLDSLGSKRLCDFGLPQPTPQAGTVHAAQEEFNIEDLQAYVQENEPRLTPEQRAVYDEILDSVNHRKGKIFHLDAPGGTGKTFLTNLIISYVRSTKRIVSAVASCGVAATLLQGGKTARTFHLQATTKSASPRTASLQYKERIKDGQNIMRLCTDCLG